jgi:predicted neutral ceramidase superfamily lipid hydrolase
MDRQRAWAPFAIVLASVAAEMVLASARLGPSLRPALITAMVGLAVVAVAVALFSSMGLAREGLGPRLLMAVPLVLSVALAVVLMLENHFQVPAGALVAAAGGVGIK